MQPYSRSLVVIPWLSALVAVTGSNSALAEDYPVDADNAAMVTDPAPVDVPPTTTEPTATAQPPLVPPNPAPPPSASYPPEPAPIPSNVVPQRGSAPAPLTYAQPLVAQSTNAAPAQTARPFPPSASDDASSDDSSADILRLGPVVGVGLPNLLSFGGMLKLTRYIGAGLNFGLIPSTRISYYGEATLSYQEYDVYGRIHPFGGGFFLGAGVGYVTVKGTVKDQFDTTPYASQLPPNLAIPNPLTYESQGSVKTMVLTPQIGYFYTTDIGFSIGIDIGAQVPIAPSQIQYSSQLTLPAGTPQVIVDQVRSQFLDPSDKKVRDTLNTIGRTPIPTLSLRMGWLF